MSLKIAVILSKGRFDFLSGTLLDGLRQLQDDGQAVFKTSYSREDWRNFSIKEHMLEKDEFLRFSDKSDLIVMLWGKEGADTGLAGKIGRWDKTVYVDGSEAGKNRRLDPEMQYRQLKGEQVGWGRTDPKIIQKCALHFKREKPYLHGAIPFPFGIESRYSKFIQEQPRKDIDFNCIFGQLDYPPSRKFVQKTVVEFCERNGFTCIIERTQTPDEFYRLLSRTKVGISVSGGGYDTARFWEILGNNCLLLTERIDIYETGSDELRFDRIYEFGDLYDLADQLERIGKYLRNGYDEAGLKQEYRVDNAQAFNDGQSWIFTQESERIRSDPVMIFPFAFGTTCYDHAATRTRLSVKKNQ